MLWGVGRWAPIWNIGWFTQIYDGERRKEARKEALLVHSSLSPEPRWPGRSRFYASVNVTSWAVESKTQSLARKHTVGIGGHHRPPHTEQQPPRSCNRNQAIDPLCATTDNLIRPASASAGIDIGVDTVTISLPTICYLSLPPGCPASEAHLRLLSTECALCPMLRMYATVHVPYRDSRYLV